MTTVIEVFDELKASIDGCLTGYKRLENPLIPEDNASNLWTKAYGIAIGPGGNPELFSKLKPSCTRDFSIILLHKITTTDNQFDRRDDQQKDIVNDMDKIKLCLEADPDLGELCTKAVLSSDTGVEFIDGERGKFIFMEGIVETLFFA